MIFLPNRGTDMMCQNNFGGKNDNIPFKIKI